jgi:hypothetical protein
VGTAIIIFTRSEDPYQPSHRKPSPTCQLCVSWNWGEGRSARDLYSACDVLFTAPSLNPTTIRMHYGQLGICLICTLIPRLHYGLAPAPTITGTILTRVTGLSGERGLARLLWLSYVWRLDEVRMAFICREAFLLNE